MHLGESCPDAKVPTNFSGGITNGAAWYPFSGNNVFLYFSFVGFNASIYISNKDYSVFVPYVRIWKTVKYTKLMKLSGKVSLEVIINTE